MSFTTSFNDNSNLAFFLSIGCSNRIRRTSEKATFAEDRPSLSQMDAVRHAATSSTTTLEISADLKLSAYF